jgi:hypothetical protein
MARTSYSDTIRRAALPAILFAGDIALALHLSEVEARREMEAGRFGLYFKVGRRPAILRDEFLKRLASSARSGVQAGPGSEPGSIAMQSITP